jgi:hypothetical protein
MSEPQKPEEPPSRASEQNAWSGSRGASFTDRWVLPFVHEPTLWPVLVVAIGQVAVLLALLLLMALRDRRPFASGVLTALALLSVAGVWRDVRRRRRLGAIGAIVLAAWLLGAAAALAADRYGLF